MYELYEKYKIKKYGFHGTSHKYVSMRAAEILGKPYDKLKVVTCHLGNGAKVRTLIIPTNEELVIARDTKIAVSGKINL